MSASPISVFTSIRFPGSLIAWLAASFLGFALVFGAGYWANQFALDRLAATGNDKLAQVVGKLRADLAQYEILPRLLAEDASVADFLGSTPGAPSLNDINHKLTRLNDVIGALDTYLLDATGTTLAASNWQQAATFIGQNFSFRPYYQDAMQGESARYYALGTTSNTRGYYFAHPVPGESGPIGVIVVKAPVNQFETSWAESTDKVLVIDENGVVFLSSHPAWLYRSLYPLDSKTEQAVKSSKRYSNLDIAPLPIRFVQSRSADSGILELLETEAEAENINDSEYLFQKRNMPNANWEVALLQATATIESASWMTMLLVGLSLLSLALVGAFWLERQRRLRQIINLERQAREKLESRVDERTRELHLSHRRLRLAHGELLKAERLAALGQLSASLSHEIAQPLTAIHTYVDNVRALVHRNRLADALEQLHVIDDLTDRMSSIVKNLKMLARAEQIPSAPVELNSTITDVLELMSERLSATQTKVTWNQDSDPVEVMAAAVPVQQILLNLLSNALDAVENRAGAQVWIHTGCHDGVGYFTVRDNGPGISDLEQRSIFKPFFTTKKVGYGLGLGLAVVRRMVDAFNGKISIDNHPQGGAVVTIRLSLANGLTESILKSNAA